MSSEIASLEPPRTGLGEMLQTAPKATGGEHGGRAGKDGTRAEPSIKTATLADIGIDKKTSALSQKLAALPQEQFEQVREGATTVSRACAAVIRERNAA